MTDAGMVLNAKKTKVVVNGRVARQSENHPTLVPDTHLPTLLRLYLVEFGASSVPICYRFLHSRPWDYGTHALPAAL
eukprot:4720666-Amphidinium_carterae.1